MLKSTTLSYIGFSPARDVDLTCSPPIYKNPLIDDYFEEVELALKAKGGRLPLNGQIKKLRGHSSTASKAFNNIPEKYLISLFKHFLERQGLVQIGGSPFRRESL